jgi:Domain of Unknown Function (DUF1080)
MVRSFIDFRFVLQGDVMLIPFVRRYRILPALLAAAFLAIAVQSMQAQFSQPEPRDWDNHDGWISLFDGKTLTNWDGSADVWHVEDGAIVGTSSDEHPSGTTNIIYKGGEFSNFRLRLEMKLEGTGANGGVQYRSRMVAPHERPTPPNATPEVKARMEQQKQRARWNMAGYQADFDYNNHYTGQLYEQSSPRGIITYRGQVVDAEGNGARPRLIGSVGDIDDLKQYIHPGEWNQVEIIADGHTLTHIINGHVMSVTVDTDPKMMAATGLIALEIEGGGTLKISHRNIYLKRLP